MRKVVLSLLFISYLNFSYAQFVTLDPSFGNKGIAATDMGAVLINNNVGTQVLIQADGSKYFVSDYTIQQNPSYWYTDATVITKKHADGTTDLTYGNNGYAIAPLTGAVAAIQMDGKIVIAGSSYQPLSFYGNNQSKLMRFNTDGSADIAFNNIASPIDYTGISAIVIQADQKIVLAGLYSNDDNFSQNPIINRYNTNGSFDKGISIDYGLSDFIYCAAIEDDQKIIVAGTAIFRFNSDLTPDNTLNGNGRLPLPVDGANKVVVQSDGKIIVSNLTIQRFDSSGTPDNTFATNGVQTVLFGGTGDRVNSSFLQSNGQLIIAGYTGTGAGANYNFAVARFNSNGTPDNSFAGDGSQSTSFNSSDNRANSVAPLANGKLIVLGYSNDAGHTYTTAASYNSDGTPDASFNANGTLIDKLVQGSTFYSCTAVQTDGKVIAAGYSWNGTDYDFAIARYNSNGSLDNTFSGDGKQMTDFTASNDKIRAIAIQSDGKIVAAGNADGSYALARYNTDGSLDPSFNSTGKQTSNFGEYDTITTIVIQPDGKIIAGGIVLARYNSDGSPDMTFGINGFLRTAYHCNALLVQDDSKIISLSGNDVCSIARYNTDGSVDNTFGSSGFEYIYSFYGDGTYIGKSLAFDTAGKIVIGGYSTFSSRQGHSSIFELLVLNTDGTQANSFNGGQNVMTTIHNYDFGTSVKVQSDNKIILGGYSYNGAGYNFILVRYNTDGSLDNTFSPGGVIETPASGGNNELFGMAITPGAIYAAGFGQFPGNLGVVAKFLVATGGPLPVSLTSFTATLQASETVGLNWQTISEQNLSGFTVERSADGNSFSEIAYVTAKGNSNVKLNYSTIDLQPLHAINFYRLRMTDINGKITYSKVVSVNVNDNSFTLKLSPNPTKNTLFIRASGDNEKGTFVITDVSGRIMQEIKVDLTGDTYLSIDVNNLPNGVYNLQLHTTSKAETKRFIKQ